MLEWVVGLRVRVVVHSGKARAIWVQGLVLRVIEQPSMAVVP